MPQPPPPQAPPPVIPPRAPAGNQPEPDVPHRLNHAALRELLQPGRWDLPALFKANVPTITKYPLPARQQFAEAVAAADGLIDHPDPAIRRAAAWLVLLLPTLLLHPVMRGGRGGASAWNRRFRLFWSGDWTTLRHEALAWRTDVYRDGSARDPTKRALQLVKYGELSRAASQLTAAPLAPANDETMRALEALHPSPPVPIIAPAQQAYPRPVDLPDEMLLKGVQTSSRGAAQGPTGWRFEHLRTAVEISRTTPLPRFTNGLLYGTLPPDVLAVVGTSRLVALQKPNGGIRPVAIGDVLRRYVTRGLCLAYKERWEAELGPFQYAIGTKAGSEKLLAMLRTYAEAGNPEQQRVLLALDSRNAFNTANRQDILDALQTSYPELLPFFSQWYGVEHELWFRHEDGSIRVLHSRDGTQQGDPAGTFLYALGLHKYLVRLQELLPGRLIASFLDDIYIGTTETHLAHDFQGAAATLAPYRQELRPDKCQVWSPNWNSATPRPETVPAGLKFCPSGMTAMGVPFGDVGFVAAHFDKLYREKHLPLLEALGTLQDPQSAYILLRYCAVPKLHYHLRSSDPTNPAVIQATQQHDEAVERAAIEILSLPNPLPPAQHEQLRLPLTEGGLGLTPAERIKEAAFLGSVALTLPEVWARHAGAEWMPQDGLQGLIALPWVQLARAEANALNVSFPQDPPLCPLPESLVLSPVAGLQTKISAKRHAAAAAQLCDFLSLAGPADVHHGRDLPRIQSCRGVGASAWLGAIPCCPQLTMSPPAFLTSMRLRLGLPHPTAPLPGSCVCGESVDAFGDHLFCCKRGGQRITRHDTLVAAFQRVLKEGGCRVAKEQLLSRLQVPVPQSDTLQRIDLEATLPGGTQALLDVTIAHPCRADDLHPTNRQNRAQGEAAKKLANGKVLKYGQLARAAGYQLIPLAGETFGHWDKPVHDLLHKLGKGVQARHYTAEDGVVATTIVNRWWMLLSVSLQKENGRMLTGRAGAALDATTPAIQPFPRGEVWGRGPFQLRSMDFS